MHDRFLHSFLRSLEDELPELIENHLSAQVIYLCSAEPVMDDDDDAVGMKGRERCFVS